MTHVLHVEYRGTLAPYDHDIRALADVGATLTVTRCADGDDVVRAAESADVVWLEWSPPMDRSVLERLPRTGLVMRWGVGYDQIDVAAASDLGIVVANAPRYCTDDVAEHTIALLLGMTRQVVAGATELRASGWASAGLRAQRLRGATVGVVGLGRIGRRVAALLQAFGARVIGYDVAAVGVPGVEQVTLERLWADSDIVCLHAPHTAETHHLVNADVLSRMKPDARLVNVSRGGLVDTDALLAALAEGHLASAALDVFETEPLPADHPLRAEPRVILTPHQGASSQHSIADLRSEMCAATVEWLTTGWTSAAVNPQIRGTHRRVGGSR